MSETFECANCGEVFTKDRPDSEAIAEAEARHGVSYDQLVDPVLVCDDCHHKILAWWQGLSPERRAELERQATR